MNLLIIFGGISTEHEVSRDSAASILRMLNYEKYKVVLIGIDKIGKWMLTQADECEILNGCWENKIENKMAWLSPDASIHGVITENGEIIKIDCVWPILHGKNGEDGAIQGLCELAGIKYVGSGICSSAMCMDKAVTKRLVAHTDIRQASYYIADYGDFIRNREAVLQDTEEHLQKKYPLFVKPTVSGSSVGISKAKTKKELLKAYEIAFNESSRVLVEQAIIGQEVEVAILGNNEPIVSRVGEILTNGKWYDYDSKYGKNPFKTIIPANINRQLEEKIQTSALEIYKLTNCKGLARIDFFISEEETVIFNEINTLPGFTEISMYPKLWEATGIKYPDLLDKIISYATE